MIASIPAAQIVSVIPNVIGAGGSGLNLVSLVLTNNNRVPIGTVYSFPTPAAVAAFFGPASQEAAIANVYFLGFDNSNIKPAILQFAQYPTVAVPGYLTGGSLAGMTLSQLQALTGTLILTVGGVVVTSGTINLSSATSFSNAAALIQTGLNYYDAVGTGSITGTVMTISAVSSGVLAVGQVISGPGVTPGTKIISLGTGTGGTGTYNVSVSQTVGSTTISAGQLSVGFDAISNSFGIAGGTPGVTGTFSFATGTLATPLKLTLATGAYTSQGAPVGVPATNMNAIIAVTQNFGCFMTTFEPSTADCVAFAAWNNTQGKAYAYLMWDTDPAPTLSNDTTSAGYLIRLAGYDGCVPIYAPTNLANMAAFAGSIPASTDFTQREGRANAAFRSQSGLVADVTNVTIAANLLANGYNFYGSYGTRANGFTWFYNGQLTGEFAWFDSYIDQMWMNDGFQVLLMTMLGLFKSIPYNDQGYSIIRQTLQGQIDAALFFGAIRAGVPLSPLQAAEVNNAAGFNVADTITQLGYYTLVLPASPTTRAARASPPCTFFYTDGQSIQKINLASVEIA